MILLAFYYRNNRDQNMAEENFTEDASDEQGILEEEKFDVFYECLDVMCR